MTENKGIEPDINDETEASELIAQGGGEVNPTFEPSQPAVTEGSTSDTDEEAVEVGVEGEGFEEVTLNTLRGDLFEFYSGGKKLYSIRCGVPVLVTKAQKAHAQECGYL